MISKLREKTTRSEKTVIYFSAVEHPDFRLGIDLPNDDSDKRRNLVDAVKLSPERRLRGCPCIDLTMV